MSYLICGVGQAGGAIVDEMFGYKEFAKLSTPLAINSTMKDLQALRHVPRSNWLGLSEAKGIVHGTTTGFENLVVGGFGKDPRLAEDLLSKNFDEVVRFFSDFATRTTSPEHLASKRRVLTSENEEWEMEQPNMGSIPFALIVLGLGGGTGCGASSIIARAIREASAVTTSIIVVGILPATHEASKDGARGTYRQAWNTLYALEELKKHADGFILVDNERLAFTSNIEVMFPEFNTYIARALADLLSAHLLEGVNPADAEGMSLKAIDIRDITSAISFGAGAKHRKPGFASIGWAADTTQRYSGYLLPGLGRRLVDCSALFEVALRKQSIQGIQPEKSAKNLGLIRLPIRLVKNRRYFPQTGVVEAQLGKMSTLNETHFGITLARRPVVSVNTLFTYESNQIPRVIQLSELAAKYNEEGVLGL